MSFDPTWLFLSLIPGGKTLYTHDRDLRKFEFLDVRDPFA